MSDTLLPRYTLYLLQNSEGSFSGFFQSDALMISFLERLLSSLATTANSLGVELEIGSTGVHVVELWPIVVTTAHSRGSSATINFIHKGHLPSKEHGHTERSGHDSSVIIRVSELDRQVGDSLGHGLHLHLLVVGEPVVLALHSGSVNQCLRVGSQTLK